MFHGRRDEHKWALLVAAQEKSFIFLRTATASGLTERPDVRTMHVYWVAVANRYASYPHMAQYSTLSDTVTARGAPVWIPNLGALLKKKSVPG